jgi:hypothetical protein
VASVWVSRRALGLHAVIIVIVPTFAALCIWQLRRALSGNELSWAYVFEWPFFAGYAIYMWWRFVHEVPAAAVPGGSGPGGSGPAAAPDVKAAGAALPDDRDAADLAAYNRYLAELAERDKPKRWR